MIRRPPRSTLFPSRRSSDLGALVGLRDHDVRIGASGDLWQVRDAEHLAAVGEPSQHRGDRMGGVDRKSTRLNSSHANISYAVFCLKKKKPSEKNSNEVQSGY